MTVQKRLNHIVLFAVVLVCAFITSAIMTERANAAGNVTDETTHEVYNDLASALRQVPDGATRTLTVRGSSGTSGIAITYLPKNAKVTIVPGEAGATILNGISGGYDSNTTLTFGNDDTDKSLLVKGGIVMKSGTVILNKNFTIETKGYGLTLGDSRDDVSVKAYVNGSTINSTADVAVLVRRKQAVVEEINDATLIGNRGSYDGAVVVLDYGKINKIKNTTITADNLYGVNAARGGQIESIEGGSITCAGTLNPKQGYAVAVRQGVADAVTKIGTLKGVDITCTAIGQNYNTAGIHVDSTGSGLCQIDTIDSCNISTQGNQYFHAGIQIKGKAGQDDKIVTTIKDCKVNTYNGASGIYITNAKVGTLENNTVKVNISDSSKYGYALGLRKESGTATASIESIVGGSYENCANVPTVYNYCGNIGSIKNAVIRSTGTSTSAAALTNTSSLFSNDAAKSIIGEINSCTIEGYRGVYNNGGRIEKICNNSVLKGNGTGQNPGIYNTNASVNSTYIKGEIGTVENSTVTGQGMHGLWNEGNNSCRAYIDKIDNTNISSTYSGNVQSFALYNAGGEIFVIDSCKCTATEGTMGSYGIFNSAGGQIETVKNTTVNARNRAIHGQQAVYGSLINNKATGDVEYGLSLGGTTTAKVVDGGTYIGGKDAVLLKGGVLNTITGDAVFYGKNGYAINNKEEPDGSQIEVEPKLNDDQPMMGYARYYGSEGATNNHQFYDPEKDKYPIYGKDTDEEQTYSMSESTVPVDGIDGVKFHYLTINATVEYDSNGGEGDMTEDEYTGEWKPELKVASNKFTLKNHTFAGWNTKSDGKGKSYSPGDEVDTTKLILYAQWTRNAPTPGTQNLTGEVKLLRDNVAKPFEDGEFSVNIEEGTGNPVDGLVDFAPEEVGVPSSGLFSFAQIKFAKEGTYNFLVSQKKGTKTGYIYDLDSVNVEIEVVFDDDKNTYVIQGISYKKADKDASGILFINEYKPLPCKGDPPVEKKVTGDPIEPETFAFELRPLEYTYPMPDDKVGGKKVMTIEGAGSFEFGEITFDKEGIYAYTVLELIPKDSINYKYDNSIWKIVYEVVDNNGQLEVTRTFYKNDEKVESIQSAEFVNEYEIVDEGPQEEEYSEDPEEDEDKDNVVKKAKVVQQKVSRYAKTGDDFNVNLWLAVVFTTFVLMMFGIATGKNDRNRTKSR